MVSRKDPDGYYLKEELNDEGRKEDRKDTLYFNDSAAA